MRGVLVASIALLAACQSAPLPGDYCSRASDCASPLVCSRGRCRGACARSDDCPSLSRCLADTTTGVRTCSLDVDSCRNHPCAVGFLCRDDECVNACESDVRCPDGVCESGACVPVHGGDAGPPVDAATDAGTDAGPPIVTVTSLGGGADHFCVTGDDSSGTRGGVWCWGVSLAQELGDRTITHGTCSTCSSRPVRARDETDTPFTNVTQVATQPGFTCAVRAGEVLCWGTLPAATPTPSPTPVRVRVHDPAAMRLPVTDAVDIALGIEHVCVRRGTSLDAWCSGVNADGRLGTGDTTMAGLDLLRAGQLPSGVPIVPASEHTVALASDGSVVGVGSNNGFALGVPDPADAITAVTAMEPSARLLASGNGVTCIVRAIEGDVACWGAVNPLVRMTATATSCGLGTCDLTPTLFAVPERIEGVAIAQAQRAQALCVWTATGHAYCVGEAPIATSTTTLSIVQNLDGVERIEAGENAMCALRTDHTVWCWGQDDLAQLGDGNVGSAFDTSVPVQVVF